MLVGQGGVLEGRPGSECKYAGGSIKSIDVFSRPSSRSSPDPICMCQNRTPDNPRAAESRGGCKLGRARGKSGDAGDLRSLKAWPEQPSRLEASAGQTEVGASPGVQGTAAALGIVQSKQAVSVWLRATNLAPQRKSRFPRRSIFSAESEGVVHVSRAR